MDVLSFSVCKCHFSSAHQGDKWGVGYSKSSFFDKVLNSLFQQKASSLPHFYNLNPAPLPETSQVSSYCFLTILQEKKSLTTFKVSDKIKADRSERSLLSHNTVFAEKFHLLFLKISRSQENLLPHGLCLNFLAVFLYTFNLEIFDKFLPWVNE